MNPKITLRPNGPYLLTGPLDLVDPQGNVQHVPPGKVLALCRCGQAKEKPFCDGSHNGCGFKHDTAAPLRF
jgi:CDGSH-type Zn-finger protein